VVRNIPARWDDEGRDWHPQESAAAQSIWRTAIRSRAGKETGQETVEISPYLNFSGQCAAAFKFYEQCLGGKIVMMQKHGETLAKDHVPADWRDKVVHARLVVGGRVLMGSDAPPTHYSAPQRMQVSISVSTPAEGERIFKALAEHGKITLPFQKTAWSSGLGTAVDRFGIPWMVNCVQTV
jgi:PhnB protein